MVIACQYAVNCAGITRPRTLIGDYALQDYQVSKRDFLESER